MRTFVSKQQQKSGDLIRPPGLISTRSHFPHGRRPVEDQAASPLLQADTKNLDTASPAATSNRFAHDFIRIPLYGKASAGIQPKLTVNAPGDTYEQEADRIAGQVMSTPLKHTGASSAGSFDGRNGQTGHERIQARSFPGSNDPAAITAPPIVHEALSSPGRPLDSSVREFMEPRFGHDFSRVRVHTGETAARSAAAVNATAYTAGNNIVFGARNYAPQTAAGKNLLAHELTHVVQQRRGGTSKSIQRDPQTNDCNPPTAQQMELLAGEIREAPQRLNRVANNLDHYLGVTLQSDQRHNFIEHVRDVIQLCRQFLTDYRRGNLRICVSDQLPCPGEACFRFPEQENLD